MRERTVTISSAGKTFSFTGWKIGWACAPAPLTTALRTTKQFLSFTNGTPLQYAVAVGLGLGDDLLTDTVEAFRRRRDLLYHGLRDIGFEAFRPDATYFVTADIRSVGEDDGLRFCRELPERVGVAAVPEVVFFDDKVRGAPLVRFTFAKAERVIEEGLARLRTLTQKDPLRP